MDTLDLFRNAPTPTTAGDRVTGIRSQTATEVRARTGNRCPQEPAASPPLLRRGLYSA